MRIAVNIILSIFLFCSLNAEKKIENIKIKDKGYYQIYIYLNESGTYDVKFKDNIFKLYLKKYSLSKNFPGSEFELKSEILKKIFITKSDSTGIIFNFMLGDEIEYIVQNFQQSALIAVSIYSNDHLSKSDRLFFKGLRLENGGEKEKALIEYRKLLAENPNHPEALFHAGIIRKELGYNYQSKSNFQLAKKSNDCFLETSYQLSDIYNILGDEKKSKEELNNFKEEIDKQRQEKYDSSAATVSSINLFALNVDSDFNNAPISDTASITAKTKPVERKIIKTIPVNSNSYYYTLIANIFVVLVAIGSIAYIWRLIVTKRKKQNNLSGKNKINIDLKENISPYTDPAFNNIVKGYKDEMDSITNDLTFKRQNKNYRLEKVNSCSEPKNELTHVSNRSDNDIDRLAQKYQVERGKIELALKIIAKNDTESTKDKYMLLMKMLKENMSLEELAYDLRIPRGELELVMNLKNI